MNALIKHRGLEQLHGGTHADKTLPVFLQRQSNPFLFATGYEAFDESAIVSNTDEIVLGGNLGQPMDDCFEVDRLARRRLQQASVTPGAIVAAFLAIAIEQAFFR